MSRSVQLPRGAKCRRLKNLQWSRGSPSTAHRSNAEPTGEGGAGGWAGGAQAGRPAGMQTHTGGEWLCVSTHGPQRAPCCLQEIKDQPRISVFLAVFSFHSNKVAYRAVSSPVFICFKACCCCFPVMWIRQSEHCCLRPVRHTVSLSMYYSKPAGVSWGSTTAHTMTWINWEIPHGAWVTSFTSSLE